MTTLTLLPPTTNGHTGTSTVQVALDYAHVFNTLVENRGNIRLTCELLCKDYNVPLGTITKLHVIDAIKDKLPELKQYMDVVATLELFSLMPHMSKALQDVLTALEPAEILDAFFNLHKLISAKIDTQKIDVTHHNEIAWKMIPAELREAWLQLETGSEREVG